MYKAWNILESGKIVLITADYLAKQGKYSQRGNFYCDYCLLPVQYVYTGNPYGQSPHFRHMRVDDINVLERQCPYYCESNGIGWTPASVYKRVGLPLVLIRIGEGFELRIMFSDIENDVLESLYQQNVKVKILADDSIERDDMSCIYSIRRFQLGSDGMLHRLPFRARREYVIKLEGVAYSALPEEVKMKWLCGARGIPDEGALFHFGKEDGMRVAKNGFVRPGKWYWCVRRVGKGPINIKGIDTVKEGPLYINDRVGSKWEVWKIRANVINKETRDFFRRLDCLLVEEEPQLIPLWPPAAWRGRKLVYPEGVNNAIFAYKYGLGADDDAEIKVLHKDIDSYAISKINNKWGLVRISVINRISPVMIRREYVPMSFEIASDSKLFQGSIYKANIRIIDADGNEIIPRDNLKLPKERRIRIEANVPIAMRLERSNIVVRSWLNNEKEIRDIMYGDKFILDARPWDEKVFKFDLMRKEKLYISFDKWVQQIKIYGDVYVKPGRWVYDLFFKLECYRHDIKAQEIINILKKWLILQKIPVIAIPVLKEINNNLTKAGKERQIN